MRTQLLLIVLLFSGGCAGALTNRFTLPDRNTLVRDQLVFHSDFSVAAHHRLFDELTAQRTDLCRQLALPTSDEPINVYLFESQERFEKFMRLYHPEFPDRRAFFIETDTQLSVYAQWGDRLGEDLRHEVTHGYLHSVAPNMPLWLDEGLAEYYEVSRGQRGLNRPHLDRLLTRIDREHWRPDMRRLEQFSPTQDMTQDDYAEAWAWVHFLIETRPENLDLLREHIGRLRRDGSAPPLSARLAGVIQQPDAALIDHIRNLQSGKW